MFNSLTNAVGRTLLIAAIGTGPASQALAADVRVSLSQRETYVGLPVMLQIQVNNATKVEAPTIPATDGVEVKAVGTPARSTQITTINGHTTTRSSLTYRYEITPQRSGRFHIPPITVHADGANQLTQPIDFVASKSETDDFVFAEIAGKEKEIYVGQSLDLTLKIWLRPYRDNERNLTLSEADMWRMISDRTNWGPFADRLQEMSEAHQRPAGREVLRKDKAGVEHSYYLYEIDATIYPKRPGAIAANDVKVVVNYPTALGKSRDPFGSIFDDTPFGRDSMFGDDGFFASPFGSRLMVKSVRPIVAEAAVESINVLAIPAEGRPADYRGAVGEYKIATEATPTNVRAGDPINLLIGISGTGPMELVQAPPLADLPELTADFKVPSEPLAGFVKDDRKVFSTTIRPRKEGIAQLPPLPFSYFDPAAKRFVTVHSDPISLHVEPADTLALENVVQRNSAAGADPQAKNSAASLAITPTLTISTGEEALRDETSVRLHPAHLLILLAVPPLLVVVLAAIRTWRRLASNGVFVGPRNRRISQQVEIAEHPAEIANVLRLYLSKRFRLNRLAADDATMVGALRTSGNRPLAVRCERLLQDCAGEDFGHAGRHSLQELRQQALTLIQDLKADERKVRPRPVQQRSNKAKTSSRLTSTVSAVLIAVTVVAVSLAGGQRVLATDIVSTSAAQPPIPTPHESLSIEQKKQLLAEASSQYEHAQSVASKDSADAKQAFSEAAEKYELLIRSGVRNSQLFVNIGNAYLQAGQTGRAIANYRRSLKIDPTNHIAAANIIYAEGALNSSTSKRRASAEDVDLNNLLLADIFSKSIAWLNMQVSSGTMLIAVMLTWMTLWTAIGLRMIGNSLPWKSIASASFILFAIALTCYAMSWREAERNLAVVVTSDAVLRDGDGSEFPSVQQGQLHEGQTVEVCKQRGDWLQVRNESGQVGWLRSAAAEAI